MATGQVKVLMYFLGGQGKILRFFTPGVHDINKKILLNTHSHILNILILLTPLKQTKKIQD